MLKYICFIKNQLIMKTKITFILLFFTIFTFAQNTISGKVVDQKGKPVQGANIYIKKPNDFGELKRVLSEVININWQYHTSGLNKDNFLLRM